MTRHWLKKIHPDMHHIAMVVQKWLDDRNIRVQIVNVTENGTKIQIKTRNGTLRWWELQDIFE